jgi:hypothetical protein
MSLVSSFKGWVGEMQGTLAAKIRLDSQIYRSINNVTIPAANGTTQIDHVKLTKRDFQMGRRAQNAVPSWFWELREKAPTPASSFMAAAVSRPAAKSETCKETGRPLDYWFLCKRRAKMSLCGKIARVH